MSQNAGPPDRQADAPQSVAPPTSTSPTVGERPHFLSIAFSTLALLVSVLSFFESYQVARLNEEVDRPLVRVASVESGGPVLGHIPEDSASYTNSYHLRVRNSGKTFARDLQVHFRAQLDDIRAGLGFRRFTDDRDATTEDVHLGELAPDEEYPLTFWASVLRDPPKVPFGDHLIQTALLYVKGAVSYASPITGKTYTESFCFFDTGSSAAFTRCVSKDEPRH